MTESQELRFRWRCSRCMRDNDEKVRDGWTLSAYALCQCGQPVELLLLRDLDGSLLEVREAPPPGKR